MISRKVNFGKIRKAIKYAYYDYYDEELKSIEKGLSELYHLKSNKIDVDKFRLDKVLEKFTKAKYDIMYQIDLIIIVYENNKFHLGTWYEGLETYISLDTVEHLIADMESE